MSRVEPLPGTVVIGVGNPDAGDDAAGPLVAEAVRAVAPAGVEVLVHEDPADLTLLWRDRDLVVVVDAVCSGDPAGSVRTMVVSEEAAALESWPSAGSRGTHDFGLSSAAQLSHALGTLPRRLVLVGVEGRDFTPGHPMTRAVRAAVPEAVDAVIAEAEAAPVARAQGVSS